ncbi:hypothetical protein K0P33_00825 [Pseudomonas sp. ArH3a]|uniref:hypothetical protein n=1 Tax=Pseudomonas sp. ArH3a TaxID=2862945 RepID=UPI001F58B967|nr:hypothetical protein [Pseudomonas sp. ArH3a]UNM20055.1 hypothetical protein K0P33_00825 [Pseudomonas sp. ArH3a]
MPILTRLSPREALLAVVPLCFSAACWADKNTAELSVSGTMINPACTASFPASQTVDIPKANLNSLKSHITDWSDVALSFRCSIGSQVKIRLTPFNGSFNTTTLPTTLDKLGLNKGVTNIRAGFLPGVNQGANPTGFFLSQYSLTITYS